MELQIQDLINAIKKDGVDAAQQQAENIIAKANKHAQDIIAKAEAEAERIVKNAENREEVIRNSIIVTAEHARRDALLSFKESVRSEFEKILGVEKWRDIPNRYQPGDEIYVDGEGRKIYVNGMTEGETTMLTLAMARSGETLDLSTLNKTVVDKHSTGGVGDKITIVLMPIIASLGIPVAKMSGRGLGFTGGTIDKLESIPGYNIEIPINNFIEIVKKTGISVIGQTANLAPADKKLYALRDTIACVDSMPLIASSIMSKKIAAGAEKIVLDVTVGSGAFMKDKESAIERKSCW